MTKSLKGNFMKKILSIFAIALLAACQNTNNTNSTYSAHEIGQTADVSEGKIVSMRAVQLNRDNTIGTAGGAVVGGALGSQIGGNDGVAVAGAIGGAILGGLIGGEVEDGISNTSAVEFIVKKSGKNAKSIAVVQTNEENLRVGDKVLIIDSSTTGGTIKLTRDTD
jgi:outer membrane lipoprotein SlyB